MLEQDVGEVGRLHRLKGAHEDVVELGALGHLVRGRNRGKGRG